MFRFDRLQSPADGRRNRLASPLAIVGRLAFAATEPGGARDLGDQRVELFPQPTGAANIVVRLGLFDFPAKFVGSLPVLVQSVLIEHLAGGARGGFLATIGDALAQNEGVDMTPRLAQQVADVQHADRMRHAGRPPAINDQPRFSLPAKYVAILGIRGRQSIGRTAYDRRPVQCERRAVVPQPWRVTVVLARLGWIFESAMQTTTMAQSVQNRPSYSRILRILRQWLEACFQQLWYPPSTVSIDATFCCWHT